MNNPLKGFIVGALAGTAATIPMSWAMELMHQILPAKERHPLPPRQITERVAKAAGINHRLGRNQMVWLSLVAHLGYGAMVGGIFGALSNRLSARSGIKGTGFGILVWAGSYLGLLPALGILTPATKHPVRRSAVMIIAHLVWGSATGMFADTLRHASHGEHPGFLGADSAPGNPIAQRREKQHA